LTRATRIDLSDPSVSRRVGPIIKKRQQGKCHYCDAEFGVNDILISCGNPRSYYHKQCAKKIHII
jgi:hypothetical protein